jgi:serine phosphatase RsbU (regulator of sigma subunit)
VRFVTVALAKLMAVEAANANDDFFGEDRLELAAACDSPMDNVFSALNEFCAGTPFNDDCTVVVIPTWDAEVFHV